MYDGLVNCVFLPLMSEKMIFCSNKKTCSSFGFCIELVLRSELLHSTQLMVPWSSNLPCAVILPSNFCSRPTSIMSLAAFGMIWDKGKFIKSSRSPNSLSTHPHNVQSPFELVAFFHQSRPFCVLENIFDQQFILHYSLYWFYEQIAELKNRWKIRKNPRKTEYFNSPITCASTSVESRQNNPNVPPQYALKLAYSGNKRHTCAVSVRCA